MSPPKPSLSSTSDHMKLWLFKRDTIIHNNTQTDKVSLKYSKRFDEAFLTMKP